MKSLFICLLAAFIMAPTITYAQKKKKEKKPYEWKMPSKLSGNQVVDEYINSCNSTYESLIAAKEAVSIFRIDTTYTKSPDGELCYVLKITDQEGNKKNFSTTLLQSIDVLMSTTDITLNMTNISLQTTTATLEMASNPLLALTHGKYIKDGPLLVAFGGSQIGGIVKALKGQISDLKMIKQNAVDLGDIKSTDQVIINKVAGDIVVDDSELADLDSIDMGTNDGAVEVSDEKLTESEKISES